MKINKVLLIALPLLLAAVGCNDNHGNYHYNSEDEHSATPTSSEGSSEKQSSEEEPLPTKTPEELEAESRQAFAIASNLLATATYRYSGEGANSYDVSGIIGTGVRLTGRYDSKRDRSYYYGYFANKNGVLGFNGNYGYWDFKPNGYAIKTNNLQEAVDFVENFMPRFEFKESDWEYIGNTNGVSVFKTTSQAVKRYISFLETGTETGRDYTDVYATINANGDFVQINTQSTIPEISNYINFYGFNHLWDDKDGNYQQPLFEALPYKDFSDEAWDFGFQLSNFDQHYIPFPSFGDRYYFLDWVGDMYGYTPVGGRYQEFKIGFINTGDRISDYASELITLGYENDPGETTIFTMGNHHISLTYVTPQETGHADLYPNGIFYINHYAVSV